MSEREQKITPIITGYDPDLGRALWRLEDTRRRTLEALENLPEGVLDWHAPHLENSIGTLLYHIAAIEMDWTYLDLFKGDWTEDMARLFPIDVRDGIGRLSMVTGLSLNQHLERLQKTRQMVLEGFIHFTDEQIYSTLPMPQYDLSPAWVLHHLAQHEAEHRGEIMVLKALYEANYKN